MKNSRCYIFGLVITAIMFITPFWNTTKGGILSAPGKAVLSITEVNVADMSVLDKNIVDMSFAEWNDDDVRVADLSITDVSIADVGIASANFADASKTNPHVANKDNSNNRPQTQTLLSSTIRHGGFGSPIYGVTTMNGQTVFMRGTRGVWVMNLTSEHTLHLGLAGYRTRSDFDPVDWMHHDVTEPELRANYGGFEVEYVNRSHRLVHMGAQLLIGSGNVRYDDRDLELDKTRESYFVLQPGANLMLNVTRWFRISGGVYYRHTGDVNLAGTSGGDLSGITGILGLRFGRF